MGYTVSWSTILAGFLQINRTGRSVRHVSIVLFRPLLTSLLEAFKQFILLVRQRKRLYCRSEIREP